MIDIDVIIENKNKLISDLKNMNDSIKIIQSFINEVEELFNSLISMYKKIGTDNFDEEEYWNIYRVYYKKYKEAFVISRPIQKNLDTKMKLVVAINDVLKPKHRNPAEFERYIETMVNKRSLNHFEAVAEYCEEQQLEPENMIHLINNTLKQKIQKCCEAQNLLNMKLNKRVNLSEPRNVE